MHANKGMRDVPGAVVSLTTLQPTQDQSQAAVHDAGAIDRPNNLPRVLPTNHNNNFYQVYQRYLLSVQLYCNLHKSNFSDLQSTEVFPSFSSHESRTPDNDMDVAASSKATIILPSTTTPFPGKLTHIEISPFDPVSIPIRNSSPTAGNNPPTENTHTPASISNPGITPIPSIQTPDNAPVSSTPASDNTSLLDNISPPKSALVPYSSPNPDSNHILNRIPDDDNNPIPDTIPDFSKEAVVPDLLDLEEDDSINSQDDEIYNEDYDLNGVITDVNYEGPSESTPVTVSMQNHDSAPVLNSSPAPVITVTSVRAPDPDKKTISNTISKVLEEGVIPDLLDLEEKDPLNSQDDDIYNEDYDLTGVIMDVNYEDPSKSPPVTVSMRNRDSTPVLESTSTPAITSTSAKKPDPDRIPISDTNSDVMEGDVVPDLLDLEEDDPINSQDDEIYNEDYDLNGVIMDVNYEDPSKSTPVTVRMQNHDSAPVLESTSTPAITPTSTKKPDPDKIPISDTISVLKEAVVPDLLDLEEEDSINSQDGEIYNEDYDLNGVIMDVKYEDPSKSPPFTVSMRNRDSTPVPKSTPTPAITSTSAKKPDPDRIPISDTISDVMEEAVVPDFLDLEEDDPINSQDDKIYNEDYDLTGVITDVNYEDPSKSNPATVSTITSTKEPDPDKSPISDTISDVMEEAVVPDLLDVEEEDSINPQDDEIYKEDYDFSEVVVDDNYNDTDLYLGIVGSNSSDLLRDRGNWYYDSVETTYLDNRESFNMTEFYNDYIVEDEMFPDFSESNNHVTNDEYDVNMALFPDGHHNSENSDKFEQLETSNLDDTDFDDYD